MNWRKAGWLLTVVLLSAVLAFVCDGFALQYGVPTPGMLAVHLLPAQDSYLPLAFFALVDFVSFFAVLTAIYAIARGSTRFYPGIAVALSIVLALEYDGFAFKYSLFSPALRAYGGCYIGL
jgi:hypothetical protein